MYVIKWKCIISFNIFFSTLPGIDQTNLVCINDDQGRVYQNCKFHTSHFNFFSINILHIDCYCVKGLRWCFLIQLLIFIYYYNGAVDMQICALLTRRRCKSLILRWPLRPVGLLSEILSFVGLLTQFHGLSHFFLFRLLDWHQMHLIS